MASNGKLIKASNQYRPASNIVIGGADLSDLPNKQDIINEHLLIARESAEQEAQSIINQAKQEAENIINQADEIAKQTKLNAYEEGFQIGKAEAMMIIKDELKDVLINAKNVLKSIEREREECLEDEQDRIYKTIVLIAKHLLKRDLALSPKISTEFISEAIKKIESKALVKIYVDTDTAQGLHTVKNELIETNPGLENLTIIANPTLNPGDLVLESNTERLDLRLETQLEELASEILS
jgi:flagellar assembly protein FliH